MTVQLFRVTLDEEMTTLRQSLGDAAFEAGHFPRAAELFDAITTAPEFSDFLTLSAYRELA